MIKRDALHIPGTAFACTMTDARGHSGHASDAYRQDAWEEGTQIMRIFGSLMGIAILVALLLGSGCAPMQLDQGMDMTEKAAKTAEEPD